MELIVGGQTEQPVILTEVSIQAEIAGSIALTNIEMSFFNPNDRVLEGSLNFPLLDGQNVVRFAMDMNGQWREAVPVEKAKGQKVFEEIVRRGVDPGLLEKTEGNNYRARIYPILAKGVKRVAIGIQEVLVPGTGGAHFRLPLNYPGQLKKFSLEISVPNPEVTPSIVQNSVPGLTLPEWNSHFSLAIAKQDFTAQGLIDLVIPPSPRPQAYTQRLGETIYFYSEINLPTTGNPRAKPKQIAILWDSSASGGQRDHGREYDLLDQLFKAWGNVTVEIIRLRNSAESAKSYQVTGGDWASVRTALAETTYDGATTLGNFKPNKAVDQYLLFSDGLNNFGSYTFPETTAPLHAIVSAAEADIPYLKNLAERSLGELINLLVESPQEATARLLEQKPKLLGIDNNPSQVAHIFSNMISPTAGVLAVAGVLRTPQANLTIHYGLPGSQPERLVVALDSAKNSGHLAARAWAQLKINALEPNYRENRADILRTGQEFGIVTRETSLIILDRLEDYIQYDITPPADLREAFNQQRVMRDNERQSKGQAQINRIVQLFQAKVEWWSKDFPKNSRQEEAAKRKAAPLAEEQRQAEMIREREEMRMQEVSRMRRARETSAVINAEGAVAEVREEPMANRTPADVEASPASPSINEPTPARVTNVVTSQLQKWTPNAPYLEHFQRVPPQKLYDAYLEERPEYLKSSAFFLDAADFFIEKKQPELALRILSNLAEMDLENAPLLRILGYRLQQLGQNELAIFIFERVKGLRPEEPQSYRDLGLAYAAAGQFQKAIDLLWEVVSHPWDDRFPAIELIALTELNAIAEQHPEQLDLSHIDPRLRQNLPLDLRVILTWDADNTDIDLWITDPNGEKCAYNNSLTYQGGRLSSDFQQGYGPEEFSLRTAKPGRYIVEANYYGNRQQIIAGATTIQLTFSTKFGTEQQQDQSVTLRLKDNKEVVKIGEFTVKAPQEPWFAD
jgi:tetratricopeptide (TPR) repeat protein